MAVQIYTFKVTYAECDNKIWRTAAVLSNYTLSELGYMVLATFDTMAYHLFEMKYKGTTFFLTEEDFEDLPYNEDEPYDLLGLYKIGKLGMNIGDTIEMTYDFGCEQVFNIELLEIGDMPAFELLEAIKKTDADGHSGIFYSSSGFDNVPEWDYRNYDINTDNCLLKGIIVQIRDGYENNET